MHSTQCPVCRFTQTTPIYTIDRLPVHSVRLASTAQEARDCTTGRLTLHHCPRCCMVWNSSFDRKKMSYDGDYEETQGYSSTFQDFQNTFAKELIATYHLSGKTVLEIGSGKGELLATMIEHGIGYGIGYDPSFDPSRFQFSDKLEFHQAFYPPPPTATGVAPAADCYTCIMTLEHIDEPRPFIQSLRDSMPYTALLVIQVPALERIIDECAYWDIYYEHCNYFCLASLTTLLQTCGFAIEAQQTLYQEQYLQVVARPSDTACDTVDPKLNSKVMTFSKQLQNRLEQWRKCLLPAANNNSLLIWGAASKAVALLNAIPELKAGVTLVDINPHKHHTFLPSTTLEIYAPHQLSKQSFQIILIANPVYQSEVEAQLLQLNISGDVIALGSVD